MRLIQPSTSRRRQFRSKTLLPLLAAAASVAVSGRALGQVTLSGTSYTQDFVNLGSGLPTGWTTRTGASAGSLGTSVSFTATANSWADTGGAFKNLASATSLTSSANTATQNAATNRALGVRPTGSFGDPGQSFTLQIGNTTGFYGFNLSIDAMMLSVQTRSTDYSLQYGLGTTPASYTTLATYSDPGVFGSTTISIPSTQLTAIQNQSSNVWIRFVALSASTGTGSQDTVAIDNFSLTYSTTPPTFGTYWDTNGTTSGIGGAGTWSSSSNTFATTTVGTTVGTNDTASNLKFEGTGGVVTVSGTVAPAAGFTVSTSGYSFSGGTAINLAGSTIAANTITVDSAATSVVISTPLNGSNGLTKDGGGSLILSTTNPTFTGGLAITNGIVQLGAGRSIASTNALSLANNSGAAFDLNGNPQTVAGLTGGGTTGGNVTTGAATGILTVNLTSGPNTFSGNITGSGGLTKSGAGTLVLSGNANSYSGPTLISLGTLQLGATGTLGSGALTVGTAGANAPSTFDLNGRNATVASLTLNGGITSTANSGSVTLGGGVLTVTGNVTYGPLNTSYYPSVISGPGALDLGGSARIFSVQNNNNSAGDLQISSVIQNGAIIKTGAGILTLGGSNTYLGNTTINHGTLRLTTGADRLPTATVVSLGQASSANLGTFDLNGQNQTIAGLNSIAGTSTTSDNLVTSTSAATLTITGSGSFGDGTSANSGVIGGAISVVKSGSGVQTLGDFNTYTGTTTVSGGTLSITGLLDTVGAPSTANDVTVSGGTLAGTGNLNNRRVFVNSGAIAPGTATNAVGTLSTGSLTLANGSNFNVNVTGTTTRTADQINVRSGSSIAIGSIAADRINLNVSPSGSYTHTPGESFVIINNANASGSITSNGRFQYGSTVINDGGQLLDSSSNAYRLAYAAGTGTNDVVLTALAKGTLSVTTPATPVRAMVGSSPSTSFNISAANTANAATVGYTASGDFTTGGSLAPNASASGTLSVSSIAQGPITRTTTITPDAFNINTTAITRSVTFQGLQNRMVSASTVDIGRRMSSASLSSVSGSTNLTTTGANDSFTSVTVASTLFDGPASELNNLSVSGSIPSVAATGTLTTLTTTAEAGVFGTQVPINVEVPYSATVLTDRTINAATVGFGRVLRATNVTQSATFTTPGTELDNARTRVTLAAGGQTAVNEVSVAAGTAGTLGNVANTALSVSRDVVGNFATPGSISAGSRTVSFTDEFGVTRTGTLNFSATVLEKRAITAPATVALGVAIVNTPVPAVTTGDFTTTGDDTVRTRVNLAGNSLATVNGVSATGSSSFFDDGGDVATRVLSGSFPTAGNQNGTLDFGVTTAEAGLGDTYTPVPVAFTGHGLNKANPSFESGTDKNSHELVFNVEPGSLPTSKDFTIFNFGELATTARLDLTSTLNLTTVNGLSIAGSPFTALNGGEGITFSAFFDPGSMPIGTTRSRTYNFSFTDNGFFVLNGSTLPVSGAGATPGTFSLTLTANVIPEPLTVSLVGLLSARLLLRRRVLVD
jgi:fibronectin-binding autotransporter adhesin